MGRVIRIGVAALVLYAVWQAGSAYWQYLEIQDRVERIAQFGTGRDDDQVRAAVADAAAELGISLDPQKIGIRSGENSLSIDAEYERPIRVLPGVAWPWTFTIRAHAWLIPSGGIRKGAGMRRHPTGRALTDL